MQFSQDHVKLPWGERPGESGELARDYTVSPRVMVRSLTRYNVLTNDLQQAGVPHGAFTPSDRQLVVKINCLLTR